MKKVWVWPAEREQESGSVRLSQRSWALWILTGVLAGAWLVPSFGSAEDLRQAGSAAKAGARVVLPAQEGHPAPDPSGASTGGAASAQDASGATFIPPDPGAPPDTKKITDPQRYQEALKLWQARKKALDEYTQQAKQEPLAVKLAASTGHNRSGINLTWILVTGMLIVFMQAGFALMDTGLCRAKNAAHTMAMNFMIFPLALIGFYVCGFAFMYGGYGNIPSLGGGNVMEGPWTLGNGWNVLGTRGFFLAGNYYDASIYAIFFFQMVYMAITAAIPMGACAERWKFSSFMVYGIAVGTLMYPVYGCWVWGGGWCSQLGTKLGLGHGTCDFSGSSVVHLQGGVIAFWFAKLLGPRLGKYNKDGSPNPMPPHSLPMVMLGTFILAFGWLGLNAGGSLAGTDLRNAMSVVNTLLASAAGAIATTLWMWKVRGNKPDPSIMCNGTLAGLVAISASCAFVNSLCACLIGAIAGILVVESVFFVEKTLRIDDPVGAISVHGVNGMWGILALGLFADGTYGDGYNGVWGRGVAGLFYHDGGQLAAQAIGAGACVVYLSVCSFVVFKLIGAMTGGHRPSPEVEFEGLDVPEMGCLGYCGIVMDKASESPVSR